MAETDEDPIRGLVQGLLGRGASSTRDDADFKWMFPPRTMVDGAAWDRYWLIGILFSHSHRNGPRASRTYPISDWFHAEGWPICQSEKPLTGRSVRFFSSSG